MTTNLQEAIVIGAGVIGLATAYELAKRGLKVTVVDQKEAGWAASHGNAGMIYPAAGMPMINPKHMKAGIGWLLTRGGESPFQVDFFKLPGMVGWGLKALGSCNQKNFERGHKAFQDLGADTFDLFDAYKHDGVIYEEHQEGLLSAFILPKEFNLAVDLYAQDPSVEFMDGDQAREREPMLSDKVIGAAQLTQGFTSVYPPSVCTALARRIEQLGVEIRPGVEIVGAQREGRLVRSLKTDKGEILRADHFVVAAGGWSGLVAKTLESHVSIAGGKGYALTMEDPTSRPGQTIFFPEYEAVMIPFDGKVRFTGFLELTGVDMQVLPRRIEALRSVAGRYLKQVPTGRSEKHWTGMRACSPDGVPSIGLLPGLDNAWVGTGHWHFGLTLGPSTAKMLAELITTGRSAVDNGPFDPARI